MFECITMCCCKPAFYCVSGLVKGVCRSGRSIKNRVSDSLKSFVLKRCSKKSSALPGNVLDRNKLSFEKEQYVDTYVVTDPHKSSYENEITQYYIGNDDDSSRSSSLSDLSEEFFTPRGV